MQRIKRFFKKADPVTLALVALLGVSTVFAWVQIVGTGQSTDTTYEPERTLPVWTPQDPPTEMVTATPEVFIAPIDGDFNTPTVFFDETSDDVAVVASGLFKFQVGNGIYTHQSQGMSFANADGRAVDVIAPLSGVVSAVMDDDPIRGTVIQIDHDNGMRTYLTGVYDVAVATGDTVTQGQALGVTGLSRLEPNSGNVVHMEVFQSGLFVNPAEVIGVVKN